MVELFQNMSVTTFMLVTLGIMLIVVEFFQPSHRFPTYCGIVLIALGITLRMLGGGTFIMLFYMLFFCTVIIFAVHIIMLATQKKAWLTQSLALKLESSISEEDEYSHLLGRDGIATTDIDGSGHITVEDVILLVTGDEFISKGTKVRIVRVSGDSVRVVPVYDEE